MSDLHLSHSTGVALADRALSGAVGLFEEVFPRRIRGYYLVGSYAYGRPLPTSDLDLKVVFKEKFRGPAEEARARRIARQCSLLSQLDLAPVPLPEDRLLRWGASTLKGDSVLVYGEEIRDRMPEEPLANFTRSWMHRSQAGLLAVRGNPPRLAPPLGFPDPEGEFFGYDSRPLNPGSPERGIKALVTCLFFPATAVLAWRHGARTTRRSGSLAGWRERMPESGWTALLGEVYERCRERWSYRIPADPAERAWLRGACERALGFERWFLTVYREFLLQELRAQEPPMELPSEDVAALLGISPRTLASRLRGLGWRTEGGALTVPDAGKLYALRRLLRTPFPDPEMDETLRTLAATSAVSANAELRRLALAAITALDASAAVSAGVSGGRP